MTQVGHAASQTPAGLSADWVNAAAARRIDLDALRRRAEPYGALGTSARDAHRAFGRDTEQAWRADVSACRVLAQPDVCASLSNALAPHLAVLEPIDAALARAAAGDADEADLFRIKRSLYHAWRVLLAMADVPDYAAPPSAAATCERWLRVLEGAAEPRSRFSLSDGFDAEMAALRAEHSAVSRDVAEAQRSGDAETLTRARAAEEAVRARLDDVEERVVRALGVTVGAYRAPAAALEGWLATLDFRFARARLSSQWRAWPSLAAADGALRVTGGWLPASRARVEASGGRWQPISLRAERGVTLLTGPNMGGKTQSLLMLATVQVLAQLAYPVPAELAAFTWVDGVDYLGGEQSDASAGLSSFAGEMMALRTALEAGGERLMLVDELGRGTSPAEGRALAVATSQHLSALPHRSVMVTHFAANAFPRRLPRYRVRGLAGVDDAALQADAKIRGWQAALNSAMDFALVAESGGLTTDSGPVAAVESPGRDALRIARLLGLPAEILSAAEALTSPAPSAPAPTSDPPPEPASDPVQS